jgi:hypothetical protein
VFENWGGGGVGGVGGGGDKTEGKRIDIDTGRDAAKYVAASSGQCNIASPFGVLCRDDALASFNGVCVAGRRGSLSMADLEKIWRTSSSRLGDCTTRPVFFSSSSSFFFCER